MKNVVLFDGVCNLCNSSVQFIIKRDSKKKFQFTSMQSITGEQLLKKYQINKDMDSFILIKQDRWFEKSSAALQVCKNLDGIWKIAYLFVAVPKPIRDIVYNIIAKNRYKWFGKRENCMMPTPEIKDRFLE